MSDAFEHVIFRGKLMDNKTKAFLMEMEAKLDYELTVVQGCYNPGGVAASGGTHDGGGVVDLAAFDWAHKVRVGADLGAFIYHRVAIPGLWGEHVHMGIRDHGRLSDSAQRQQGDWDHHPPLDALASHRVWNGYHPGKQITYKYQPEKEVQVPEPTDVTKARDALVEAIHATGTARAMLHDADETREAAKKLIPEVTAARRQLKAVLEALPPR